VSVNTFSLDWVSRNIRVLLILWMLVGYLSIFVFINTLEWAGYLSIFAFVNYLGVG